MRYNGVDIDHPTIADAIKNMVKQGRKIEEIARVVGVPHEVVKRHAPDAKPK